MRNASGLDRRIVVILAICAVGCATAEPAVAPTPGSDPAARERAYLEAWYAVHVERDPTGATRRFESLLADPDLSDERRLMCRLGVVECLSRTGLRNEAIRRLEALRGEAATHPVAAGPWAALRERLGQGRHEGTFKFHYQQGFDFERGEVVDLADADVVFQRCAGGISSITLAAAGGITNLESALGRRATGLDATQLYESLVGAPGDEPGRSVELGSRAKGDSRTVEADVFVLRTRTGGWAKLAIVHRGTEGGWTKHLATVRYLYDPDAPSFGADGDSARVVVGGIAFNREPKATDAEKRAHEAQKLREAAEAARRAAGGGDLPDPEETQEVLLSRSKYSDYEKATYSFRFGIRDDPGLAKTGNNWDLQFGNGGDTFSVVMVTDDRSTITDLGESTWEALSERTAIEPGTDSRTHATYQHVFVVRTEDTDALYFTFVRVACLKPGIACAIEWVSLQDGVLKTSPRLALAEATKASLERLLATVTEAAKRSD